MRFCKGDDGQDVVEYSLLIAFVMLLTLVLLQFNEQSVAGILSVTTSNLDAGNRMAS